MPHTCTSVCLCGLQIGSLYYDLHHNQPNTIYFQHVANMMIRMKREFPGSQNSIFPVFDTLLLLDRNVDLLTPLATQLTYEGLIDEIYGIQNSEYGRRTGRSLVCLSRSCCVRWIYVSLSDSDMGAAHLNLVQGWFCPKLEPVKISSASFFLGRGAEDRVAG